jgi:chaperonin GroES
MSQQRMSFSVSLSVDAVWHNFGIDNGRNVKHPNNKNKTIMTIKPLADRVLVVPAPAEEKIGGIIIPDTAKEKPLHGIIKAVGKGTKDEEMILKEGDEVLYGKYSGTELEFGGEKYLMMRQSDVLAVIEK